VVAVADCPWNSKQRIPGNSSVTQMQSLSVSGPATVQESLTAINESPIDPTTGLPLAALKTYETKRAELEDLKNGDRR